eukprot:jgi/Botrbrau1/19365/Bobra.0471s0002.1
MQQEILLIEESWLMEDPEAATVKSIAQQAHSTLNLSAVAGADLSPGEAQRVNWVVPFRVSVKLRLFCLPYAGGVSENVFAKWSMMLPPGIQVCPVELPGRGRRQADVAVNDVVEIAETLAHTLPLEGIPYAIFGTCLGAIIGYEIIRVAQRDGLPMPVAFFPAAVSPPHLYSVAVMKLYLTTPLRPGERPPTALYDQVLTRLKNWNTLTKEQMIMVFEKGNFAGLDEMKRNDRLFNRVAPMGVNDIIMAVQYQHREMAPLNVPIIAFDGVLDGTIDRGNMDHWDQYTASDFKLIPVVGDHYFVSVQFRQVVEVVVHELAESLEAISSASTATQARGDPTSSSPPQLPGTGLLSEGSTSSPTSAAHEPMTRQAIELEIMEMVVGFVGHEVSVDQPLAAQGLDSLAAMELRQKLQERFSSTPTTISEDPEGITVSGIAQEIAAAAPVAANGCVRFESPDDGGLALLLAASAKAQPWIAPAPIMIKIRIFCFAPEGCLGERFFARWQQLPACVQICIVELPGHGRLSNQLGSSSGTELMQSIVGSLPTQDKPFALFGASFGGILAYEAARATETLGLPLPSGLFIAGCAPPQVFKQTMLRRYGASTSSKGQLLESLQSWKDNAPHEALQVLKRGRMLDMRSIEEDESGDAGARAMGDLISCLSYDHVHSRTLPVPITSIEGLLDETVEPGLMPLWSTLTSASFCNIPIAGGHDFLLSNHQEVEEVLSDALLDIVDNHKGGILGEAHSWVG